MPDRTSKSPGPSGAGSEAAEGIHSADGDRDPTNQSGVESQPTGRDATPASSDPADVARSGSEPLVDRETEHRSGYGGAGGKPVRSSDQREKK